MLRSIASMSACRSSKACCRSAAALSSRAARSSRSTSRLEGRGAGASGSTAALTATLVACDEDGGSSIASTLPELAAGAPPPAPAIEAWAMDAWAHRCCCSLPVRARPEPEVARLLRLASFSACTSASEDDLRVSGVRADRGATGSAGRGVRGGGGVGVSEGGGGGTSGGGGGVASGSGGGVANGGGASDDGAREGVGVSGVAAAVTGGGAAGAAADCTGTSDLGSAALEAALGLGPPNKPAS
jgi:hypothetical protein